MAGLHHRVAQLFAALLGGLFVTTLLLWSRDLLTIIIVLALLALVVVKLKYGQSFYLRVSLQVTAVMVLLNSIKSPWYLNPFLLSQYSVISRCSSNREVKKVMMCPSSNQLFRVSRASGYTAQVPMRSGSSLGMSSQTVPSISIK